MWCDRCQRDVPILRQPDGGLLCPQCGSRCFSADSSDCGTQREAPHASVGDPNLALGQAGRVRSAPDDPRPSSAPEGPTAGEADSPSTSSQATWWNLEARLRDLRFALDSALPPELDSALPLEDISGGNTTRKARPDRAHDHIAAVHWARHGRRRAVDGPDDRRENAESAAVLWVALALGLTSFVCGSILLGWSLVLKTAVLGFYGVPMSAVGLAFLLVAAIFRGRTEPRISRDYGRRLPHRNLSQRRHGRRSQAGR